MILSAQQIFSDNQAITSGSTDSTNTIDLGVAGTPFGAVAPLNRDIGKGTKVPILIQVTETFNNLTSLNVAITSADTLNNPLNGDVIISVDVPLAKLVVGYQFVINVLPDTLTDQYFDILYTVTGSAATTGKITAGISMGNQTNVTGA